MPDAYGRPTISDGLALYGGLRTVAADQERAADKAADKQTEAEIYQAADTLAQGGDLSGYSPKAKAKAAELHWGNLLKQTQAQVAVQQKDINKFLIQDKELEAGYNRVLGLRNAGKTQEALDEAMRVGNLFFNGYHLSKDKNGDYKVQNIMDGSKKTVSAKDITVDQALEMLGSYMGMGPEERIKRAMTGTEFRQKRNLEHIGKTSQAGETENGILLYKVEAGTTDPIDGSVRGAFFSDAAGNEVPEGQVKGWMPYSIKKDKAEINSKRAAAAVNWKNYNQPNVVNPDVSVQLPGGDRGLLTTGKGGAKVMPISGSKGVKVPSEEEMRDPSKEYKFLVDQFNDQLAPFVKKGTLALNPDTFEFDSDANNAIQQAVSLVEKAQKGEPLTENQQSQLSWAQNAVDMFQKLTELRAQNFGLQTGKQRQIGQHAPPLPKGFVPDNKTIGP